MSRVRRVSPQRKFVTFATFSAMTALVLPLGGCPDEDVCRDYSPPGSLDLQNPPVSFSREVLPIFAQHCTQPSCHGSTIGSTNGVTLGGDDATHIHQAIVDVRSSTLPTMSFVKPGDP